MVSGPWLMAQGSWLMPQGSWLMATKKFATRLHIIGIRNSHKLKSPFIGHTKVSQFISFLVSPKQNSFHRTQQKFLGFFVSSFLSFLVSQLLSFFVSFANFHFMFSGRYWSHIQDFHDFFRRVCIIFRSRPFPNLLKMSEFLISQILRFTK